MLEEPARYLDAAERAASTLLRSLARGDAADVESMPLQDVQVMLYRDSAGGAGTKPTLIRDLSSDHVNKLVTIRGIVTAASKPRSKATHVVIQCRQCRSTKTLPCRIGVGNVTVPRVCDSNMNQVAAADAQKCPVDPYIVLPHRSRTVDQQTLKIQELTEDIEDGDLPRSLVLVTDRQMVNKVVPGSRVTIYGIYSIYTQAPGADRGKNKAATGVRQPYLRVVGIEEGDGGAQRGAPRFTPEEERAFQEFAKQPNSQQSIFNMIAPQIFGHEHIKKALACLLFGGARKMLADGASLRGDLNVLLLGDPSTAKSQFLKFVERTAPVAVYTSGKGSSAAGLTASVIRDANTREFYLEGGAMVLADGGVCCIDEFDKMRPEDRVAIHEAMEQQTISIAKAGITTVLNARTSVLAAANPPSGRYDDLKTAEENIDLQTTILSRFDMIFLVRDERTVTRDTMIAKHVLRVHQTADDPQDTDLERQRQREQDFLKRYIMYAKQNCDPKLNDSAQKRIVAQYCDYRQKRLRSKEKAEADQTQEVSLDDAPGVPITVRQLEALIRISEALARMTLSAEANDAHVDLAIQMFNVSTAQASQAGIAPEGGQTDQERTEMQGIVAQIKKRIAINSSMPERRLVGDLVRMGLSENAVRRAIILMARSNDLVLTHERKQIKRVR